MSTPLRQITYSRYEHTAAVVGDEDEVCTGTLLSFVHDIPYFGVCGIFPPFHVANEIFHRGSAGGGMSPGTTWEPFTISEKEYADLVEAIQNTPVDDLKPNARYAFAKFTFDSEFDQIRTWLEWITACGKKYRPDKIALLRKSGVLP